MGSEQKYASTLGAKIQKIGTNKEEHKLMLQLQIFTVNSVLYIISLYICVFIVACPKYSMTVTISYFKI